MEQRSSSLSGSWTPHEEKSIIVDGFGTMHVEMGHIDQRAVEEKRGGASLVGRRSQR